MNTQAPRPTRTLHNEHDGHTYWVRPRPTASGKQAYELWACPTLVDGTPEFASALSTDDFDEPLTEAERRRIVAALTEVREVVWKDEGRDEEGRSIGPAYAEDASGEIVISYPWTTWKRAHDVAKALQVELKEV